MDSEINTKEILKTKRECYEWEVNTLNERKYLISESRIVELTREMDVCPVKCIN
jgi:hypothetical protein